MMMESEASPVADADADADGASPVERLTFREHLWDGFEAVWQKRVLPSRRQLEVLMDSVRQRAQLERQYANGLLHSVAKLQQLADEGEAVPTAVEAVLCTTRNRAEQSHLIAEELEEDVAATLEAVCKQHSDVSRLLLADGQRLTRHWQEACKIHDRVAARYVQVASDAEEASVECHTAAALRPSTWKPLAERAVASSRRAWAAELEYRKGVDLRNAAAELHNKQMGQVMAALQDMEEKRAQCFRDAAMKLAVYETSWLRNVQYDLDACVAEVEAHGPIEDLQGFIRGHRSDRAPPAREEARGLRDLPGAAQRAPRAAAPSAAAAAVGALAEATARQVETLRPLLRELLTSAGGPLAGEAALATLRQALAGSGHIRGGYAPAPDVATAAAHAPGDAAHAEGAPQSGAGAANRAAFCQAVRLELRGLPGSPASGHVAAEGVVVPMAALESLCMLIAAALDGCDREGDAWNGRDLLVLARALRAEGPDGKQVSALLRVYSHPLWSRVPFWEDLLLVGIAEAHIEAGTRDGAWIGAPAAAPGASSEVPVVTSGFLEGYVGYMVALGIRQEQAQLCMQRALRKEGSVLGAAATEAYIKRLMQLGAAGAHSQPPSPAQAAGAAAVVSPLGRAGAPAASSQPPSPAAVVVVSPLGAAGALQASSQPPSPAQAAGAAAVVSPLGTDGASQVIPSLAQADAAMAPEAAPTPADLGGLLGQQAVATPAEGGPQLAALAVEEPNGAGPLRAAEGVATAAAAVAPSQAAAVDGADLLGLDSLL